MPQAISSETSRNAVMLHEIFVAIRRISLIRAQRFRSSMVQEQSR
ncbi:MAG: hypothetical protein OJF48_003762 [Afipia sp.]|nr:MAG: hypothetical protein OJF48_003762 [Afipia sp.]